MFTILVFIFNVDVNKVIVILCNSDESASCENSENIGCGFACDCVNKYNCSCKYGYDTLVTAVEVVVVTAHFILNIL